MTRSRQALLAVQVWLCIGVWMLAMDRDVTVPVICGSVFLCGYLVLRGIEAK